MGSITLTVFIPQSNLAVGSSWSADGFHLMDWDLLFGRWYYGQNFIKDILIRHSKPAMTHLNWKKFQQDNDPKHIAKWVLNYLNGSRISATLMSWPPQSPNLNPIEKLWFYIDFKSKSRLNRHTIQEELLKLLKDDWSAPDPSFLHNYVDSMQRRCQAGVEPCRYWM